ncbi:zinc finger and SCAN domain-containing protein 21-like isoform X2 [Colossoma macropomum]|nr:zinc finger and SCAN domain-containing protein 21-like isoform X2 [Colossoma macropomum]XP_036424696.1 zinc finger and SCAN domain-containing protein 21-like isoform X2 [Colossoma macropomum]
MAMSCLAHVKKEEDSIFLQPVKEEHVETELCPSFIDFIFKQEEEVESKPDVVKEEFFNSTAKKEEPSELIVTPLLDSTSQIPETENLNHHISSLEFIRDGLPTQRMQLRQRSSREKTVLSPSITGRREGTSPPYQSESEEDDTSDPNWRPHKVLPLTTQASDMHVLRRPCVQPRNSNDTKAVNEKPDANSVNISCSPYLPTGSDMKQSSEKKPGRKKAKQSTPTVKSSNPRKHTCETCGKAFLSKRDLKRHEHTHTGAKPFTCSVCERSFNDHGNMRKHMAVHTGAQPYSCSLCGRAFSESGNLRRHEFYVHEIRGKDHRQWEPLWHQCTACHRTFKYQKSLSRHMRLWCHTKKDR